MSKSEFIILIPSRMGATRLPNKPLLDIAGLHMIVRVAMKARESDVGRVVVACAEQEILDVVEKHGFEGILTDVDLQSGTDRIYQGYERLNDEYKYIINLQGDLPNIDSEVINAVADKIKNSDVDIATAVAVMKTEEEKTNINVVKAVIAKNGKALYFSRSAIPFGEGDLYHHIGIYAFKTESLKKFVSLQPTPLELRERLEQLRAMENDMSIGVTIVDSYPLGIDTQEDLDSVRELY